MRFGTAIERLVDNYEYAKSKIWIRDKVAWALYHTWKEADRKTEPQLTPNYCGTCKHREVPCGDLPCDVCHGYSNYEPKDEPQTEREGE